MLSQYEIIFNICAYTCKIKMRMVVGFTTTNVPMQAVPITIKVVSSNLIHGDMYSMQHYVIKFVSDLRQVSGFLHQ
jgi:hypothetical protein